MIDSEGVFSMLFQKDFDGIAKILYANADVLASDPVAQQAIKFFEREFFNFIETQDPASRLNTMELPHLLVQLKQASFTETFRDRLLDEKLVCLVELQRDTALSFAVETQHRPNARAYIQKTRQTQPEQIADLIRENFTIRATRTGLGRPATTSLFKSAQERAFFQAVRKAFPTYDPYPNVAISCVIDFESVEGTLDPDCKAYFFRAIIDSVVFDATQSYEPLYFFELDSPFHDTDHSMNNDRMKDAIFEAANVKLHRIRAQSPKDASEQEFAKLIVELMRSS